MIHREIHTNLRKWWAALENRTENPQIKSSSLAEVFKIPQF
jgi:hypothetical protein